MRAVFIAEHINGKNLHEKEFWPIYERAEALGLPLFLTNLYPSGAERMKDFFMINVLGNPQEAGYAATSLVCGGVLDAFPKLEVFLPHAGGTFPWLIGRLDLGIKVSAELKHMKKPASEYLRRFHYDLITHHPGIMRNLIDLVGVDRIVTGTDFPQGMSVKQPVDFVESIPGPHARGTLDDPVREPGAAAEDPEREWSELVIGDSVRVLRMNQAAGDPSRATSRARCARPRTCACNRAASPRAIALRARASSSS